MSAHHYFRGFAYCDSGMIPWLLVLEHDPRVELCRVESTDKGFAAVPTPS